MPGRLPEPDYRVEAAVRKVRSNGEIKWQGDLIHICSALVGEAVAVEETEAGQWQVRFFDVPIGWIDPGAGRQNMNDCYPCIRSILLPMYPLDSTIASPSPPTEEDVCT